MVYEYYPKGVCSRKINFSIEEDGTVHNVTFVGGCNGNLKAIGRLVEGQDAKKIIEILEGNVCGMKGTSCAAQLAQALKESLK